MITPLICKTEILKRLDGNVGLFFYDILSSTNDTARALGESGENFSAVIARGQEKGRGTNNRSFFSGLDEGLFMSFLFRPQTLSARDISLITPAAAVVTAKAIRELSDAEVKIKWINDIVFDDKKLCGILCEGGTVISGKPEFIVIGIGINLCVKSFPKEIKDTAISLNMIEEKNVDANELCSKIVNGLYYALTDFNADEILNEYRDLSATLNRSISFNVDGKRIVGKASAINSEGNLIAQADGREYTLLSASTDVRLEH